jgi:hypothetical protein
MNGKSFPSDILDQAVNMQDAWGRIDEQLTVGGKGLGELVTEINQIRMLEGNLVGLENQITEMRNKREALCQSAWDKAAYARWSRAYGDSTQYELVGGQEPVNGNRRAELLRRSSKREPRGSIVFCKVWSRQYVRWGRNNR